MCAPAGGNSAGQSLSDSTQTTAPNLQAKLELKLSSGQRKRLAYQGISHLQLALAID